MRCRGGGTASSGAAVRLHKICAHHTFPTHSPLQLYNLLDTTHNSGMQFAVLGTSVRTDVLQMLEKRVRSRFSQLTVDMGSVLQQPNHLLPLVYSRLAVPHVMQVRGLCVP